MPTETLKKGLLMGAGFAVATVFMVAAAGITARYKGPEVLDKMTGGRLCEAVRTGSSSLNYDAQMPPPKSGGIGDLLFNGTYGVLANSCALPREHRSLIEKEFANNAFYKDLKKDDQRESVISYAWKGRCKDLTWQLQADCQRAVKDMKDTFYPHLRAIPFHAPQ